MCNLTRTNIVVDIYLTVKTGGLRHVFPIPLVATYPVSWELKEWLYNLPYGKTIEFSIHSSLFVRSNVNSSGVYFDEHTEARLLKEGRSPEAIAEMKKTAIYELPF